MGGWHMTACTGKTISEVRRRQERGHSLMKLRVVKMRGWLLEQRMLYLWLLMCPGPRPEPETPKWLTAQVPQIDFSTPVQLLMPTSPEPVSASLSPAERYALASKAMTSDAEYQKLLEVNRREIRDGLQKQIVAPKTTSDMSTPAGPAKFVGWGLWATK